MLVHHGSRDKAPFFACEEMHYGHLHYFTKETALRTLEDAGYEVLDYSYSPGYEVHSASIQENLRKFFFALQGDLAVRILGGFRLLVLAK